MFASRHHKTRRKLCQSIRATSTLKHSSNQNGFEARQRTRTMIAVASSKKRMIQCAQRKSDELKDPLSFTAWGGMLCDHTTLRSVEHGANILHHKAQQGTRSRRRLCLVRLRVQVVDAISSRLGMTLPSSRIFRAIARLWVKPDASNVQQDPHRESGRNRCARGSRLS